MSFCSFDSLCSEYKNPIGAVRTDETVEIKVRVPLWDAPSHVRMILLDAHGGADRSVDMEQVSCGLTHKLYRCGFTPAEPALYFYRFEANGPDGVRHIGKGPGSAGMYGEPGEMWQLTVYDAGMTPPDSLKAGGVIYQIFPDRFFNGGKPRDNVPEDRLLRRDWGGVPEYDYAAFEDGRAGRRAASDYFGGDLRGIEEKLDYIKSLGVTAIYLNPIFEAHSNHRYNTADYHKIDPLLGTKEDFRSLCESAKRRGIKIVLDGVFSHTGADSVYFNRFGRYGEGGAYRDENSPYRRWYKFLRYPDEYVSWWGIRDLPEVDEEEESYLEFICGEKGVLREWMELGASGWRLDVADELPDAMLDRIRAAVKAYDPDACIIGEVWEDASNKISYSRRRRYLLGGQLDSVMNYPLAAAIKSFVRYGDAAKLLGALLTLIENYPPPVLHRMMNLLSSHDIPRAITALAGEDAAGRDRHWQAGRNAPDAGTYQKGRHMLKLAAVLQYTMPGIPSLYYGDEAGLTGYADPFNRGCFPWGNGDAELADFFRALGNLRASCPAYADGDFIPVSFCGDLCAYIRKAKGSTALTAVNRGDSPVLLGHPPGMERAQVRVFAGEGMRGGLLMPRSAVVMIS